MEWNIPKEAHGIVIRSPELKKLCEGQMLDVIDSVNFIVPDTLKEGDILYVKERFALCTDAETTYAPILTRNIESLRSNDTPIYCVYLNNFLTNPMDEYSRHTAKVEKASCLSANTYLMPCFLSRYILEVVDVTRNRHEINAGSSLCSVIVVLKEKREDVTEGILQIQNKYRDQILDLVATKNRIARIKNESLNINDKKVLLLVDKSIADFDTPHWYFFDDLFIGSLFCVVLKSTPDVLMFKVVDTIPCEPDDHRCDEITGYICKLYTRLNGD